MAFIERVQVVIDSTIKNSQSMITAQKRLRRLSKEVDSFNGVMGLSLPHFQAFSKAGVQMNTRMGRTAMAVRQATHGMKGFRMELLGVMFFGSMVMGFFTGLLRPAMDVFGVFELWSDMLTVLFLPIMQEIFPYMLDFMTWMMDLPAPVKKVIGVIALLGIAFGGALSLLGSLGLGIGSLILTFGNATFTGFLGKLANVGTAIATFSGKLLKIGGQQILTGLGKVGAGFTALASTALGAALIIGAAFIAAYQISSWGLKQQGKEYKSVWAGILGTVIDAVVGIGVVILGLGGVVVSLLEVVVRNFMAAFKSIANGFKAALSGGDISNAMKSAYQDIDYKAIFERNFIAAGMLASTTTGIKENMGLLNSTTEDAVSNTSFTPNVPWAAPTNQSQVPAQSNVVNVTNNINVVDKTELEKVMDENQRKIMDELRSLSTIG